MKYKIIKLKKLSEDNGQLIATGLDCFAVVDADSVEAAFKKAIELTPLADDWELCAVDENGKEYGYLVI